MKLKLLHLLDSTAVILDSLPVAFLFLVPLLAVAAVADDKGRQRLSSWRKERGKQLSSHRRRTKSDRASLQQHPAKGDASATSEIVLEHRAFSAQ